MADIDQIIEGLNNWWDFGTFATHEAHVLAGTLQSTVGNTAVDDSLESFPPKLLDAVV
mgnify:CR=1 FL=1